SLLLESTPAAGSTVAAAPTLSLRFNNRVEKPLSRLRLLDERGGSLSLAMPASGGPVDRLSAPLPPLSPGAYRVEWQVLSTDGLGTDLGPEEGATDVRDQDASARALELGVNMVGTAINYRHQRSERSIRTALATAISRGTVRRDEIVGATKGGYIPCAGAVPR